MSAPLQISRQHGFFSERISGDGMRTTRPERKPAPNLPDTLRRTEPFLRTMHSISTRAFGRSECSGTGIARFPATECPIHRTSAAYEPIPTSPGDRIFRKERRVYIAPRHLVRIGKIRNLPSTRPWQRNSRRHKQGSFFCGRRAVLSDFFDILVSRNSE